MPTRNQHPAQLTVMHMDPANATVLPAGATAFRTDLAYTSLWLSGNNAQSSWFMDGEVLRAALDARVGLGHGLQFGMQLAAERPIRSMRSVGFEVDERGGIR